MTLVLSHPETLHTELIVGATGARFNRFPEVHALARALRDHRIEPVLRRVREFHDKLMICEEAHGAAVSSNPQAHGIDTAGLDQQQVQMRVLVEARKMALRSMRSQALGGAGGRREAFLQDLSDLAPPCYTCQGLWRWDVARISTQAELDATLLSWKADSHGSVPHRCAETAAYPELELREHDL